MEKGDQDINISFEVLKEKTIQEVLDLERGLRDE